MKGYNDSMGIHLYKPTTPGRRKTSREDFSDITKQEPEKSLAVRLKKYSGRNNTGKITVRHRGGGVARLYRRIDFRQDKYGILGTIEAIEYDPNRGPRIGLVQYADGEKRYVLGYAGIKVGDTILSSQDKIEAKSGNRMPLKDIPLGLFVHNIELTPGSGAELVRGAGTGAELQVMEGAYVQVKLPSGEVRLVQKIAFATVGMVGNSDYKLVRIGTAGRKRRLGWRPTVRGKVMNPVDHPHGGGEGANPIGLKGGPKTPWGKKALGVKTRKRDKWSNKFILQKRRKKKK